MAFYNQILSNNYFHILMFLIVLNIFIRIYDKFPHVKKNQNLDEFLNALDNFYVRNLTYDLFILCFYILSYFTIFLVLRVRFLGKELDVITLNLHGLNNFTLDSVITVLIFILSIIFYINTINTLFYPNLIKLHYYFYQYEWYENIIDKCHMNFSILTDIITSLACNIGRYTWSKETFDESSKNIADIEKFLCEDKEKLDEINRNLIKRETLWFFVNENSLLFCIFFLLNHSLWLCRSISLKLYSVSYPILFLILLIEIHNGTIYYIYYALLFYFFIVWIKKLRYFLSVKDPFEKLITNYFYKNDIPYLKIRELLNNTNVTEMPDNLGRMKSLLDSKDELISYIQNNFIVYHVMYPTRKANEKYLHNDGRRVNILIVVFIILLYYHIKSSKYILTLQNIKIDYYLILVPLFLILCFIHKRILYDTKETSEESCIIFAENRIYKRLFIIILGVLMVPILYIMLKNKLTIFPNEIIFEIKHYIQIREIYTIEEKYKYLVSYMNVLANTLNLTEEFKETIVKSIQQQIMSKEGMTLDMIREEIEYNIKNFTKKESKDFMTSIIEKIKQWTRKWKE